MPDMRRIALRDATGSVIRYMDVSDIDNANATAVMSLTIDARCDLGHWHAQDICTSIPPWGPRLTDWPAGWDGETTRGNL